ncbi:MAG TPA: glycosyltransferase family 2 protein, partial [Candidatus Saccharimonadales bacterium]|nr:glycosyltransferase family 2 protein [Candidatus Saccharimonadales bacterium]
DDDCIPDPDWLTAGQRAFECDIKAATGKTVVPVPEPPTDYQRNTAHLATAQFVTANCFCRRSVLERIGGFDERFTMAWREDSDLHFHLMEEGVKIERLQDAVVVHPVRPAPWGVSLKEQKKSQFNALLYKKHPRLYRQHIQPGAPWHYYVMLMFLLTALAGLLGGRWPLAAFALSAWLTLTGNFALQRLRRNSRSAAHVWEMVATSLAIPPLSVFWRLYGAYKYRVWFW